MGENIRGEPEKFCRCSISDHTVILRKSKQVLNDLIDFHTLVLGLYSRLCAIFPCVYQNLSDLEVCRAGGGGGVGVVI